MFGRELGVQPTTHTSHTSMLQCHFVIHTHQYSHILAFVLLIFAKKGNVR